MGSGVRLKCMFITRRDTMCAGDDKNCPEFELHHRKFKETLDRERRSFLRSSFAAAGGAAAITAGGGCFGGPHEAGAARRKIPAPRVAYPLPPAPRPPSMG